MNRRALIFGAIGSVLMIILWFVLLWNPRQAEIEDAVERREAAQAQADALQIEIQQLQAAQRDEPLKQARRAELQAAAPDDPALGQFILDVNAAANAAGIEFMSISPSPPVIPEAGGLSVIGLSFGINGGYFQILDFMNRLVDLQRLVVIDSVNLAPEATGRLTATLGGRMFTTATNIDGPTTTTTAPATPTTVTPSPVPTAPPEPQ